MNSATGGNNLIKYIILPASGSSAAVASTSRDVEDVKDKEYCSWTSNETRMLIDSYKKFRSKVGSLEIRNFKQMWKHIANDILETYNVNKTPSNCENKWRVLERNYKKYIDNKKKTGAARKDFEFAIEMDEVYRGKRNIHPEMLLSANEEITPQECEETIISDHDYVNTSQNLDIDCEEIENSVEQNQATFREQQTPKSSFKFKRGGRKKINSKEKVQHEKLKYQEKKLQLEERKIEKWIELEGQRYQETKRRNDLLEERNKLLQNIYLQGTIGAGIRNLDI